MMPQRKRMGWERRSRRRPQGALLLLIVAAALAAECAPRAAAQSRELGALRQARAGRMRAPIGAPRWAACRQRAAHSRCAVCLPARCALCRRRDGQTWTLQPRTASHARPPHPSTRARIHSVPSGPGPGPRHAALWRLQRVGGRARRHRAVQPVRQRHAAPPRQGGLRARLPRRLRAVGSTPVAGTGAAWGRVGCLRMACGGAGSGMGRGAEAYAPCAGSRGLGGQVQIAALLHCCQYAVMCGPGRRLA